MTLKAINKSLLQSAVSVARTTKVKKLLINIDCLDDQEIPESFPKGCEVLLMTQKIKTDTYEIQGRHFKTITLPKIKLGRMGFIKLAMAFSISNHLVSTGDRILFLNGSSDQGTLDTLLFTDLGKEGELLVSKNIQGISESAQPEVFEHLLSLSVELANKGREGKPIGTIFVLGDQERVMQLSKQMIINPFKGYDESERNILNPALKETIREFSALDGAFIISDDGTMITAGRYLGAAYDQDDVPRGLGSRHIAAAGITSLTNATAIVISESTGDVRIFKNGKIVMEIEKP